MGPTQDPPDRRTNQDPNRKSVKKRPRRPRLRRCLLKGCERRFRPRRPWSRYCGDECRRKARQWSRWKAQKEYRAARHGKEKRQAQCRRYRQRNRAKKRAAGVANDAARVITARIFWSVAATGPAVMPRSPELATPRCRDSVLPPAGGRWSVCWSGSDAGESAASLIWPCPAAADLSVRRDGEGNANPSAR